MRGVFRTRERNEKVLVGKAEQMRRPRRYTSRREDKLKVKSVRQKQRVEPGFIYLISGNNNRSSANTVTNLRVHYLRNHSKKLVTSAPIIFQDTITSINSQFRLFIYVVRKLDHLILRFLYFTKAIYSETFIDQLGHKYLSLQGNSCSM